MDTNHIQLILKVYCRLLNRMTEMSEEHFWGNCTKQCPYYAGTAQGEGIECKFDDGSSDGLEVIGELSQAEELNARMQQLIRYKEAPLGSVVSALLRIKGGAGSGFHGHAGRSGKIGGSAISGFLAVGSAAAPGLKEGEYGVVWSGKPGAGGRGTAVKKAAESPSYALVRVGGAYHVIDTATTKTPAVAVKTVRVVALGLPPGDYETVYSVATSKKAAEAKAAKLGDGYRMVRAEGAYHVVKTAAASEIPKASPPAAPPMPGGTTKIGPKAKAMAVAGRAFRKSMIGDVTADDPKGIPPAKPATPSAPKKTGDVPTVVGEIRVTSRAGVPPGKYDSYRETSSKATADRHAASLGPDFKVVRAGMKYHVIKKPDLKAKAEAEAAKGTTFSKASKLTFDPKFPKIPINFETEREVTAGQNYRHGKETVTRSIREFKELIKDAPLVTNIPSDAMGKILDSGGKFLNQHATGTSRGSLAPGYRREAERNAFGHALSTPDDFPTYGYLDTTKRGFRPGATHYGDGIRAVFKPEVKERTTVTSSDSLGDFASKRAVGTPLLDPRPASLDDAIGRKPPASGYVEAQMHGTINFYKDVERIQMTNYARASYPKLYDRLRSEGFEVEVVDF